MTAITIEQKFSSNLTFYGLSSIWFTFIDIQSPLKIKGLF